MLIETSDEPRSGMARTYSLTTIKALFANATHCAYPGCEERLVFEDPTRGVRSIAVQIAHIRSEKPDGPRYDAHFHRDLLNMEENLLLLCGKHHGVVDQNDSVFTTEELLEWKVAQVAQAGGTVVTDHDLAGMIQTLESSLSALHSLLRVAVELGVVGCWRVGSGGVVAPLAGALGVTFPDGEKGELAIGVQVVNKSATGIDVSAGLEFDFDLGSERYGGWSLNGPLCPPDSPHRLEGRSTANWLVDVSALAATVRKVGLDYRRVPVRFRPFAALGDGSTERGEWHDITELPIWNPETTMESIRAMNATGSASSTM